MLPRRAFERDLAETDWDLAKLMERHVNVSAQAICVRMCQLAPGTRASVWDAGKLHRAYGDIGEIEPKLVDRVLLEERPVHGNTSAWPVFDGSWRRVVIVRRAA